MSISQTISPASMTHQDGIRNGQHHSQARADLISLIVQDEMPSNWKLSSLMHEVQETSALFKDNLNARQAFLQLLLHVEKYSNLIETGVTRCGTEDGNSYITAIGQLTKHHMDWLQPVDTWYPNRQDHQQQFFELARHLLAKYDVPAFLDRVWFMGDTPEAHRGQGWFKHIGIGQNIRTADVPISLTKKMAHLFIQAPSTFPIIRAFRWAQVQAMGGSGRLIGAVENSRLGRHIEHETFWETVIRFLVNHPMLDPTYVGPIIDYIHYQKYVPQEETLPDGRVVQGQPIHPNFSMKGRRINTLLRQVDEWHEDLTNPDNIQYAEWGSSVIKGFSYSEEVEWLGRAVRWTIHELTNSLMLAAEGKAMHHCVFSYEKACRSGTTSIWSLQAEYSNEKRHRVLTIAVDNERYCITEARGKYNLLPNANTWTTEHSRVEQPYLYMLDQSSRILHLWMEQEGLRSR